MDSGLGVGLSIFQTVFEWVDRGKGTAAVDETSGVVSDGLIFGTEMGGWSETEV